MRKMCGKRAGAAADNDDIVREFKRLHVTPSAPAPADADAEMTPASASASAPGAAAAAPAPAYQQINEQLRLCHEWRTQREREREAAHRRPPDAAQGK